MGYNCLYTRCFLVCAPALNLFGAIVLFEPGQEETSWLIPWSIWVYWLAVGSVVVFVPPFFLMPKQERKKWLVYYIVGILLLFIGLIVMLIWLQVGVEWGIWKIK